MEDEQSLADVPTSHPGWREVLACIALLLIFGAGGLLAQFSYIYLGVVLTLVSLAVAGLLWPMGKEEREASLWWNGLTKSERVHWLAEGGKDMHRGAWEAYKASKTGPT